MKPLQHHKSTTETQPYNRQSQRLYLNASERRAYFTVAHCPLQSGGGQAHPMHGTA